MYYTFLSDKSSISVKQGLTILNKVTFKIYYFDPIRNNTNKNEYFTVILKS